VFQSGHALNVQGKDKRMNEEKHDLESAKMTVVCNIQAMCVALGVEKDFDELWAISLDELRELQDKLVKQYNETINRKDKR